MSVKVKNVSKYYGQQAALNNVSFEVNAGEVVGLLGPNGAGKSTMMKIITCFIPPSKGDVEVCGYDIYEQSLNVRQKVGYLPENNPLYYDMYIKEYLYFIAQIHNIGKKNINNKIKEIIDITGLNSEINKKIGFLSKGYKQRVGLAQSMIHNPDVLILDEPTVGLDPNQITDIRSLIRKIGKEKTVILSTHIMQEVEAVCDRAIIIDKGHIVADDTTENLSQLTDANFIIKIEFENEVDISFFKMIKGILKINNEKNKIYTLVCDKKHDIRAEIFKMSVQKGYTILSLQKEEQSLEKVFQNLTGKN
jgi:ABC-2 type transport system ATP-binding protein